MSESLDKEFEALESDAPSCPLRCLSEQGVVTFPGPEEPASWVWVEAGAFRTERLKPGPGPGPGSAGSPRNRGLLLAASAGIAGCGRSLLSIPPSISQPQKKIRGNPSSGGGPGRQGRRKRQAVKPYLCRELAPGEPRVFAAGMRQPATGL
ncbi:hypothetical protein ACUV84_018579 [Puccinellia chinampoensis]